MVASQKGMAFFLTCSFLLLGGCLNQYGGKQTGVPSIMPSTSPPPDFTPSPIPSTTPPPIIREGTLTVTCDVGGYGLFVDDDFMLTDEGDGTTFLTLREGTHTVLLSKMGCTSVSTLVNIRGETNTQVAFTISCEVPSPTTFPPMPPPTLPPMNPATSPPPTPLVPTTPPPITYPPPPPPPPVTIIPPVPPPVTTLPPPPTSLPTPTPPPATTYPPPTPTPSVTYNFSNLGLQNVVLDVSVQGQNLLTVSFGVPFAKSNGKVVVNVQGNNPAYLRLWVNGAEVQKGTLLPVYVEFAIPDGVLIQSSNTMVLGWGIGSVLTIPTITILNTSYISIVKKGLLC